MFLILLVSFLLDVVQSDHYNIPPEQMYLQFYKENSLCDQNSNKLNYKACWMNSTQRIDWRCRRTDYNFGCFCCGEYFTYVENGRFCSRYCVAGAQPKSVCEVVNEFGCCQNIIVLPLNFGDPPETIECNGQVRIPDQFPDYLNGSSTSRNPPKKTIAALTSPGSSSYNYTTTTTTTTTPAPWSQSEPYPAVIPSTSSSSYTSTSPAPWSQSEPYPAVIPSTSSSSQVHHQREYSSAISFNAPSSPGSSGSPSSLSSPGSSGSPGSPGSPGLSNSPVSSNSPGSPGSPGSTPTGRKEPTSFERSSRITEPKQTSGDRTSPRQSMQVDTPRSIPVETTWSIEVDTSRSTSVDTSRSTSVDTPRSTSVDTPRSTSVDTPRNIQGNTSRIYMPHIIEDKQPDHTIQQDRVNFPVK